MEEQLINFETAKLAKDKGFDIEQINFYHSHGYLNKDRNDFFVPRFEAPTQSLLQKWLREVHNIHIDCKFIDQILNFQSVVTVMNCNTETFESSCFDKYEEALEIGLQEALKLINKI